ncbi:MAG: cupredoxin domain-containing protein [Actinomycetota bacterium]|nr:cupredoxin domain-containing protein [Actinomycetota bacterium]
MRVPRSGAITAVVLLTLGAGACGKSSTTSSTTTSGAAAATTTSGGAATTAAPAGAAGTISIKNFMFQPNPAQAKVGDTITVTNVDGTNHSLTAIDGSFDTGVFSSGSKTIKLTKAGTFAIHCMIHNFMMGSVVVK